MLRQPSEVAQAAKQLLDQVYRGPWIWRGHPEHGVSLCTAHSGMQHILTTRRKGMQGSQFVFQEWQGPRKGLMVEASAGLYVPRADYASKEIVDINHPLAQLIKMLPDLVEALISATTEPPCELRPVRCCERAGEYNGFGSDGPLSFTCPRGCACHD